MSISVSASAAFFAGILNFFASCLLPLVPLYLAHLGQSAASAQSAADRTKRVRLGSIGFVFSFSIIFILFGIGFHGIIAASYQYQRVLEIAAGILLLILTVPLLPIARYTPLHRERRFSIRHFNQPFLNGLFLGLVFAVAWSPCIGPVLGAVLTIAADQATYTEGVVLTTFYSLGLALPFLVIAFAGESLLKGIRPTPFWALLFRWLLVGVIVLEALLLLSGRTGAIFGWLTQFIRIGSV